MNLKQLGILLAVVVIVGGGALLLHNQQTDSPGLPTRKWAGNCWAISR